MLEKYTTFKEILVFYRPDGDSITKRVMEQIRVYARERGIPFSFSYKEPTDKPTLIISVGGDGTMLAAMRASLRFPGGTVVGLNTGTLGFLTEEVPASIDEFLDNIWFHDGVDVEERMVLKGTLSVNGQTLNETYEAVNEFVLTGKSINSPLVTEVYINDKFVSKQMGSGVLVATSTGSTAMALSSGGAIVSPSTNIMEIVPVLSHTLTTRPIISTGRDTITLIGGLNNRTTEIEIHGDGRLLSSVSNLEAEDVSITIEKHFETVKVWRPTDWNFFDTLTKKMKW